MRRFSSKNIKTFPEYFASRLVYFPLVCALLVPSEDHRSLCTNYCRVSKPHSSSSTTRMWEHPSWLEDTSRIIPGISRSPEISTRLFGRPGRDSMSPVGGPSRDSERWSSRSPGRDAESRSFKSPDRGSESWSSRSPGRDSESWSSRSLDRDSES